MSATALGRLFNGPLKIFDAWYGDQISKAKKALRRQSQRSTNPALSELDAAMEVVHETVIRILDKHPNYTDGPEEFDKFFELCMARTINWLHSRTRLDRQLVIPHEGASQNTDTMESRVCTEIWTSESLYIHSLATVVASSKVQPSSATYAYVHNLHSYVQNGASAEDICRSLDIKDTTLSSLRARARKMFGDPERE